MKRLTAFTLVVLCCAPAMAQYRGMGGMGGMGATQPPLKVSVEVELLEMEQDADKTALKEALLLQARQGMKPDPGDTRGQEQRAMEAATLRDFIAKKKEAITARAADLTKVRVARVTVAGPSKKSGRDAAIEQSLKAQVEARLLEAKLSLLEEPLARAIKGVADAEFAAGKDEAQRDKAATARKEYDKLKTMHVDLSKELRLEQQQIGFMGGMGGGMR